MKTLTSKNVLRLILVLLLGCGACFAAAQNQLTIPKVSFGLDHGKGAGDVSSTLQIMALMTVLSLAPAIMILTTAFTRIVIIMSFLRNAIGTPSIPPNQVVIGLS